MSYRPRMSFAAVIGAALGLAGALQGAGKAAMDFMASSPRPPSFGQRYGNNPRPINGGARGHAARIKRASAKARNVAKRNRSAHNNGKSGRYGSA